MIKRFKHRHNLCKRTTLPSINNTSEVAIRLTLLFKSTRQLFIQKLSKKKARASWSYFYSPQLSPWTSVSPLRLAKTQQTLLSTVTVKLENEFFFSLGLTQLLALSRKSHNTEIQSNSWLSTSQRCQLTSRICNRITFPRTDLSTFGSIWRL